MSAEEDSIKKILILLNDSDPLLNRVTKKKILKEMGWECIVTLSYDDTLKALETDKPDAIVTEILIMDHENRDGIRLISDIRAREGDVQNKIPIIVFSEQDGEQDFQRAKENGATACYSKNETSLNNLLSELKQHIN